jgi:uncharacterized membrane protein required for colicin V production
MNPVDIAILFVVGLVTIRGYSRGFIRGVADIAGWITAIVVASRLTPLVAIWLENTAFRPVASLAAFSMVFMVALAAVSFVIRLLLGSLRFVPRIPPFPFMNRVFGLIPGVVKGAMMAAVLLAPVLAFEELLDDQIPLATSVLARPVAQTVDRLTNGALARAGVDPALVPIATPRP